MEKDLINTLPEECSTRDVAHALSLAVRSVQLMVDRGDLVAWKTPGGHRRISRASVQQWLESRHAPQAPLRGGGAGAAPPAGAAGRARAGQRMRVLLIEDSSYFQNLVRLLMQHEFPEADLYVADDGINGLIKAGELLPDVLLVDILLPGIDGATLVTRLRSHPQFQRCLLVVVTSLDETQRSAYALALKDVPVVHKPALMQALPPLLAPVLRPAAEVQTP